MQTFRAFWLTIVLCGVAHALAPADAWDAPALSFRPIGITSSGSTLWVCGSKEGIASSKDGKNWNVKSNPSGTAVLLNIEFVDSKFGYATGTGGTVLFTHDGGTTWERHKIGGDSILQASFSDQDHGLLRVSGNILATDDGGKTLLTVMPQDASILKRFRYTSDPVALDSQRMAIVIREGPYSEGGYLSTNDGGKTWAFYDPPSTGIGTLLRHSNEYWMVDMEVVGKDKPGGGGSVPLIARSTDAVHWQHSTNDIYASCHMEGCSTCRETGCLGAKDVLVHVFHAPVVLSKFSANESFTSKWAANDDVICFIGAGVECNSLSPSSVPKNWDGAAPREAMIGGLGAPVSPGIHCLACDLDPIYVDASKNGAFRLNLSLHVEADGTVSKAELTGAPDDAVSEQVRKSILQWIFEPATKDGTPASVNLKTSVQIMVIKPR